MPCGKTAWGHEHHLPSNPSPPHKTTAMHPPEEDSRLVSGEGPVNRRTALPQERSQGAFKPPQQPHLQERIQRVHTRNRLGASLQEHLAASRESARQPASGIQIAAGVVAACGCVLVLLGAIQSHHLLTVTGVSIALLGAVGWKTAHDHAPTASQPRTQGAPPAPLFDPQAVAAFDAAVEKAAADLDDDSAERLLAIKEAFKRMGSQAATAHDEHFTVEDRMYLRECLRRYIPDSLQAYLRVPVAQRHVPLLSGQPCAQVALLQQLDLLLEEIQLRETKIGRSAAEHLVRQQQFLASKKSR